MSEPRLIAVIPKNSQEEVRVALGEYKGHALIDIRTYAEFDNSPGERRPTKKGVSIKLERLPELIRALQEAEGVT